MTIPAENPTPGSPSAPDQPAPVRSRRNWWYVVLAVGLLAAGIYILSGRAGEPGAKKGAKPKAPPAPVLAQPARKGDVGIYLNGLGSVTPLNTVTVKSRVDGQLMEIRFREGQMVKRGELLAVIDPRPFQVQLAQAEGVMARDTALLKNAQVDLQRYRQLWAQDSIPKQQLDTQESLVRQYEAALKVDQGQIDAARLQLVYCRITAPVSGRVGLKQVDIGNIVHAADVNGVVVITQVQPATVVFPIPEDSLQPVLAKLKTGAKLPVEAYDREMKLKLATGSLLTVDNLIDPTTGTVKFKAVFPNERNELFPNQFVNAKLLLEIKRQSVLVPTSAIQRGPQGTFVYQVKPDKTVTVRPVTIGATQGDDTSITAGLNEGELVVVEGAERLREGAKVDLRQPGAGGGGRGQRGGQGTGGQGTGGQGGQAGQAGHGSQTGQTGQGGARAPYGQSR
ncbi:MdtA/MuxA family multidrug efflux RND transporter periplasmic adaptor subunit [Geomonas sp. Red32]|uniref:MdtA/MuxA family multidrug efflux RND transporter periplasmic adaptor subunit n=1 Tax=Geomonas sp. Red32 TaxID=2912856 RepID=UPI00202D05DC|nr:MdtA/MuxA family multidrug efflux RND transporter periplasmic adaptor subunit [Geomonas sp. Red32]MCM0081932.1 MdtA/MuxA family multidrug efflux RND transporter periplasmic adaptor subunit [Geomonas sp. Red32]